MDAPGHLGDHIRETQTSAEPQAWKDQDLSLAHWRNGAVVAVKYLFVAEAGRLMLRSKLLFILVVSTHQRVGTRRNISGSCVPDA